MGQIARPCCFSEWQDSHSIFGLMHNLGQHKNRNTVEVHSGPGSTLPSIVHPMDVEILFSSVPSMTQKRLPLDDLFTMALGCLLLYVLWMYGFDPIIQIPTLTFIVHPMDRQNLRLLDAPLVAHFHSSSLHWTSHGCPYLVFFDVYYRHEVGRQQTVLWMEADNVDLGKNFHFIFLKYIFNL